MNVLQCRSFGLKLCVMLSWMSHRFSLGGSRRVLTDKWVYLVNIILGLALPLLAIRYFWQDGNARLKSEDKENNASGSSSVKDKTRTEAVPEPDPVQVSVQDPVHDPVSVQESVHDPVQVSVHDPVQVFVQEPEPDEYFCEYDSTWDTDENQEHSPDPNHEAPRPRHVLTSSHSYKYERFKYAARDLQNYRHDYPMKPHQRWNFKVHDPTDEYPNLAFYLGKRPCLPEKLYIHQVHQLWRGNYDTLESVHSYIQWLFPLQEPGVNPEAFTLTKQEIKEFCQNDTAKKHLLESYKLMLDFYGIELCDEETGEVKRASNWNDRFTNLNRRTHNNLRITRILKCLGTLGFAHYQAPLVHFFLEETLVNRELSAVKTSVLDYFLFTVLDKKQRRSLIKFAYLNFDESEEFVWCPKKVQMKWTSLRSQKEAFYDN